MKKWQERERDRFYKGTYEKPQLDKYAYELFETQLSVRIIKNLVETYELHYPHIYKKDPSMLAYTLNDKKGEADIQTPIKPGRFLKKFCGELMDDVQISKMVEKYNLHNEEKRTLYIEQDPEKIVEVYLNGPNSCMSHPLEKFSSHIHPMHVIGANDLGIAYIKKDQKISGRALVWPQKKQHGRIYGDGGRLLPLLKDNGYTENWDFTGAKILKIPFKHKDAEAYIMPYIDGDLYVNIKKDSLILNKDGGQIKCTPTNGVSSFLNFNCTCCSVKFADDLIIQIKENVFVCKPCRKEHTITCNICSCYSLKTESREVRTRTNEPPRKLCNNCFPKYYFDCRTCNEVKKQRYNDGSNVCQACRTKEKKKQKELRFKYEEEEEN